MIAIRYLCERCEWKHTHYHLSRGEAGFSLFPVLSCRWCGDDLESWSWREVEPVNDPLPGLLINAALAGACFMAVGAFVFSGGMDRAAAALGLS